MANYIGVKCPVCSKKFAQTDDIVVCPVCGAPHHRACYAEKGECVFQGEHLSGKEWSAPKEEVPHVEGASAAKECPRCGANNPPDSLFCQICGTRVSAVTEEAQQNTAGQPHAYKSQGSNGQPGASAQGSYQGWPFAGQPGMQFDAESFRYGGVSPDSAIGGEKARDVATYVGSNTAYFMPRFQMFSEGASLFSINLSALFFGFFYFFYRKMYTVGLILLTLTIVTMIPFFLHARELMPELLADPRAAQLVQALEERGIQFTLTIADIDYAKAAYYQNIYSVLWNIKLVIRLVAATFANILYYRHSIAAVHSIRQNLGDGVEPARQCAVLTYRGGVSSLSVVSGIVAVAIAYFVVGSIVLNTLF